MQANAFGMPGTSTNKTDMNFAALRQALGAWYTAESTKGRNHTRIPNLRPATFGKMSNPECRTQGAQTNGLLLFAFDVLLPKYGHVLQGDRSAYQDAVGSLVRIMGIIRSHKKLVPPAVIQAFCDDVLLHMRSLQKLGISNKPKHHMLMHMGVRLYRQVRPSRGTHNDDELS